MELEAHLQIAQIACAVAVGGYLAAMRILPQVVEEDSRWIRLRTCTDAFWHDPGRQYLAKEALDGLLAGMILRVQSTTHWRHTVFGDPYAIQTCSEILQNR